MNPLRVLLTGFEPFDGEVQNPSADIALALVATPPDPRLVLAAEVLPVDRSRHGACLDDALRRHRPDLVLSLGQGSGRQVVDLERTAHNDLDYRGRRDNGGHGAVGEPVRTGGPATIRSTLPLAEFVRQLRLAGHPVGLSDDAGRHLCNAVYYLLLERDGLPAAFVHVPPTPSQSLTARRDKPGLPLAASRSAVAALLRLIGDRFANGGPVADPPSA